MIFSFLKPKKKQPKKNQIATKETLLNRFQKSLSKTKNNISQSLSILFSYKKIDQDFIDALYETLISADVGPATTAHIIKEIQRKFLSLSEEVEDVKEFTISFLADILEKNAPELQPLSKKPSVIILIGVNGAGKTTSIGRLCHSFKQEGKQVILAAGDTFRAAATEQLKAWGERNEVEVVSQHQGADSASVIFDAYQKAKNKKVDILLADTAGRLHNKDNLMQELAKIKRVLQKIDTEAPHETWLVIDATVGQNGLNQAKKFHENMDISGIILTKLDGTAKGGIVFAISHELNIPIRYIGTGEKINDIEPFNAKKFAEALFS